MCVDCAFCGIFLKIFELFAQQLTSSMSTAISQLQRVKHFLQPKKKTPKHYVEIGVVALSGTTSAFHNSYFTFSNRF